MIKAEDILTAYNDCRKNKRNSASTIEFECDYESNCVSLYEEINNRTYHPTKSIAFIVTKPRRREIFAANFRDRVVHHLIDIKIRPLLENVFIEKTCNNRIGKGTFACTQYIRNDIIEVSRNYTEDCWICKMDMQSFFMSIRKSLLVERIVSFIDINYCGDDKEDIKWLIGIVLMDNPENNCVLKSPSSEWNKLSKNKSLFWVDDDLGLPIGNLISQLMANFYLNEFDHYVVEELGFTHYGRYVDDFYIIDTDRSRILESIPLIRSRLNKIGITLHPNKFYFQHFSKGVELVGSVIKPGRTYIHNRTVNNAMRAVKKFNHISDKMQYVERFVTVLNSYLGFMKHTDSYNIRKKVIQAIGHEWWKYIYVSAHYYKVVVKKEYRNVNITKNRMLNEYITHKRQRNGRLTKTY